MLVVIIKNYGKTWQSRVPVRNYYRITIFENMVLRGRRKAYIKSIFDSTEEQFWLEIDVQPKKDIYI